FRSRSSRDRELFGGQLLAPLVLALANLRQRLRPEPPSIVAEAKDGHQPRRFLGDRIRIQGGAAGAIHSEERSARNERRRPKNESSPRCLVHRSSGAVPEKF